MQQPQPISPVNAETQYRRIEGSVLNLFPEAYSEGDDLAEVVRRLLFELRHKLERERIQLGATVHD